MFELISLSKIFLSLSIIKIGSIVLIFNEKFFKFNNSKFLFIYIIQACRT